MNSPIDSVLPRLHNVRKSGDRQWEAQCPGHDDKGRHLSVGVGDDNRVLLDCKRECALDDVLNAINLTQRDLFVQIPGGNGKPAGGKDWAALAKKYTQALPAQMLDRLSDDLQIPPDALRALHVGWNKGRFSFPECNGYGQVIGILDRWPDGSKKAVKGSKRGLIIPTDWRRRPGPILAVEGPSDAAAGVSIGLNAIGRPSNTGGADMLAQLAGDREIVVMGENDRRTTDDGVDEWPGRTGALRVARELAQKLRRSIKWILPPAGYKDLRAFVNDHESAEPEDLRRQIEVLIATAEAVTPTGGIDDSGVWERPVALTEAAAPDFPLSILPKPLADYVHAVSEFIQVAPAMPAAILLGVLATSLMKKVELVVRGSWREPMNLFILAVADSSERKSATRRELCSPIYDYEAELAEQLGPTIVAEENRREILKKRLKGVQDQSARAKNDLDQAAHETEAEKVALELAGLEAKPAIVPQMITDDITAEALGVLLSQNNERITIAASEGGIFDKLKGLYGGNSRVTTLNIDVFQYAYDGEQVRVNRISRSPIILKHPLITQILCVQPSVIRGLLEIPALRQRGFLSRFWYVLVRSSVGSRRVKTSPIPTQLRDEYNQIIRRALEFQPDHFPDGAERPHWLNLADDVFDHVLQPFAEEIEAASGEDGELEAIKDWAGKLVGGVCRAAGILHCIQHLILRTNPVEFAIDAETMTKAVTLGKFLREHALIAFGAMKKTANIELAQRLLTWVKKKRVAKFTRRDAYRKVSRQLGSVDEIDPPLRLLEDAGYIRPLAQEQRLGRKSACYEVNPLTHEGPAA